MEILRAKELLAQAEAMVFAPRKRDEAVRLACEAAKLSERRDIRIRALVVLAKAGKRSEAVALAEAILENAPKDEPIAIGKSTSPALAGSSPRTTCSHNGRKEIKPTCAATTRIESVNSRQMLASANRGSGKSGSGWRRSTRSKVTPGNSASATRPRIKGR
jgi:hypothetical protein